MKNAYVTMTEALMLLRRISGRLIQIEGRLRNDNPSVARAAISELNDVRTTINGAMDQLVEVQAELPEPTQDQIKGHYGPETMVPAIPVTMPPLKAQLGQPEPAFEPLVLDPEGFLGKDRFTDAILSMEEGPVGEVGDGRPAGWTEALALEFISQKLDDWECGTFATDFVEGDWPKIQKEWPEFQTWLNGQLEGKRG